MKAILVALLLCAWAGAARAEPWKPDDQTISKLEAAIQVPDWGRSKMYPKGHVPAVTEFARYYSGEVSDGHRMIYGELVGLESYNRDQAGIHLVASRRELPVIMDGGCHIVTIVYDADASRLVSLRCNGLA